MQIKAFMIPKNHEYINKLKSNLEKIDVKVKILKPFHYSSLMNIAKILFFRMKGYRIIHVHWLYIFPFSFIMKWFYYFCKILDIKIIWEMHNILPHNYNETDRKNYKWFYERLDAIIFHSESDVYRSKEILRSTISKMHLVIPHGNFNNSYLNNVTKESARMKLGINTAAKVLLCFGSIRKNRGYEYLIDALKDKKDIVLLIVGRIDDKETFKKLKKYEEDNGKIILIAKWIPGSDIQIYFNASDIVVLPYTNITTSGIIPLAYAFSKPVITTDIGGIKDVVNERTGILVPPNDAEALENAIDRIFGMDFDAMGRYAYEYAMKEFSWESNARKIKELYESISADKKRSI